jgi:hypothetical protein
VVYGDVCCIKRYKVMLGDGRNIICHDLCIEGISVTLGIDICGLSLGEAS